MATTVIKTIKSSGGDYASLAAWEAGENGNLVAADEIRVAECYGMLDTTNVTIAGGTTDATRYLIIRAAAGAEAQSPFDTTGVAYRLESTGFFPGALYSQQDYTRILRIQVKTTGDDNNVRGIRLDVSCQGNQVIGCNITQVTPATFGSAHHGIYIDPACPGAHYIVNNIVEWDSKSGQSDVGAIYAGVAFGGGVHVVWNNTVVSGGVCAAAIGINDPGNTVFVFNNIGKGFAGGDFSGINTGAYFNNASSDGSAASHTNSRSSQTFTFAGAGDYHLSLSDAGARGFGADLTSDPTFPFSTDFDGQTRVAPWDIGADQTVPALVTIDLAHTPWFQSLISQ